MAEVQNVQTLVASCRDLTKMCLSNRLSTRRENHEPRAARRGNASMAISTRAQTGSNGSNNGMIPLDTFPAFDDKFGRVANDTFDILRLDEKASFCNGIARLQAKLDSKQIHT